GRVGGEPARHEVEQHQDGRYDADDDGRDPRAPDGPPHDRRDEADDRRPGHVRGGPRRRGEQRVGGPPPAPGRGCGRERHLGDRRRGAHLGERRQRDEDPDHAPSSASYSSRTSPKGSSRRSSIVSSPAMPPYSSTTSARWTFRRLSSRKTSPARIPSGTNTGGRRNGSRRNPGASTSRPMRSFA